MSVKLQKEHICLTKEVCSRYMQTTVESDVIVPDILPDILKILQVVSEVSVTRREVQSDKIFVQGIVRMNILYVPDNASGGIKSISATQEFNHSMDIPGASSGMKLFVDAECDTPEHTLLNSRKLKVNTRVSLPTRLMTPFELDIATGVDDDFKIEVDSTPSKIYNPSVDAIRDILVRERLEVPSGKPCICEVLKISAKPYSTELSVQDGKAIARGELKVTALYCGEGESVMPEVVEHTLPFSEILEIDGLRAGMEAEVDYRLKDIYFEVCQDSDGDRRILSIEVCLEALVRAFCIMECNILKDAYCHNFPLSIKKDPAALEQLIASCSNQQTLKEAVNIPDYLPEIHCLCECSAISSIENVCVEDGEVTVSGFLQCNILYLSQDQMSPACGFTHVLPFRQNFTVEGANRNSICDAKAEAQHISATISSDRQIEVRAIVSTSIKVVEEVSAEIVSEIELDSNTPLPKMPSISVYFVQKGDTLWSIAKKYRTSPDSILSANGDNLTPGKCIYIFR